MPHDEDLSAFAAKYVNTTNRHIFLTGNAGTGKTTFLKSIIEKTFKNAVVAAPTGIAAMNAGGVTLHSLLQLPFGMFVPENISLHDSQSQINTPKSLFQEFRVNSQKRELLRRLELLIIDEVSMVRADLLDCIDHVLRFIRKNRNEPFGGLQILFIGDLLQLPPVVKDTDRALLNKYYDSPYFFDAHVLKNNPPIKIELTKVYRQHDDQFVGLLNRLRHNKQTNEDLELLNGYYNSNYADDDLFGYIHLTTHNRKADTINQNRLSKITQPLKKYEAIVSGDFSEYAYPTSQFLELKLGAQVMFLKNDPDGGGRYYNGTIGKVEELADDFIKVKKEDGEEIIVDPYIWENKRYILDKSSGDVTQKHLGSFEQYPIKLAWAVTVHKSQGLTFDKAILDLSGAFAAGQMYVALSRLRSLDGLVLASKLPVDPPGIDPELDAFVNATVDEVGLKSNLELDRKQYLLDFTKKSFDLGLLLQALFYHLQSFDKSENRSIKQQYLGWTQALKKDTQQLHDVGAKFVGQVKEILSKDNYVGLLDERMQKAWGYFSPIIKEILERLESHRKEVKSEARIKTYLKELKSLEAGYQYQLSQVHKIYTLVKCEAENKTLTKSWLEEAKQKEVPLLKNESRKEKKDKTPTSELSYKLWKEGKTVEEIAKNRGFVRSTIEGHLCQYVGTGAVKATDLLDEKKLEKILKRCEKDFDGSAELKADLGEDFSYGEIKIALAHIEAAAIS